MVIKNISRFRRFIRWGIGALILLVLTLGLGIKLNGLTDEDSEPQTAILTVPGSIPEDTNSLALMTHKLLGAEAPSAAELNDIAPAAGSTGTKKK